MSTDRPAAKLEAITPQFLVLDLNRVCAFYREKLGFEIAFVYGDFYAGAERDGVTIHLKLSDHPDPSREFKRRNEHLDAYIATEDIESLYREYQDRDVPFLKAIETTDWGTREFAVRDPEGYILYFAQRL
jgi:catechol 2,3-dioxygenase-like lactoylglutathione lyase family enzyme